MEVQNIRFCQECGREILEDYGFCPACGAIYRKPVQNDQIGSANVRTESPVQPSEAEKDAARVEYQLYMNQLREQIYISNMKLTLVMLGIWIVLSAVLSFCLLSGPGAFLDWVRSTFAMGNSPMYEGAIIASSGIMALVSAVACYKRKFWNVAFYSCFTSTILTALLIFFDDRVCLYLFLCGLLASLRVKNLRPMFK